MAKIKHTITEDDGIKILSLWNDGLGTSAIALKLALGQTAVRKWLLDRGYSRTREEGIKAHLIARGSFSKRGQSYDK